ncbi:MAG: DUF6498-containing protein [Acidobacteriia bacterium]|nr:DUF6498-containing protein [Terriglobia bacterium]
MGRTRGRPPLLTRAEVVIGNAVPVVGVAFLGWNAFSVILLYVLDGWLSILGLGASVMIQNRDEMRRMVPKGYSGFRRALFSVVVVGLTEAVLSMFAVVPGVAVLAHMDRSLGQALAQLLGDAGLFVSALMLIGSHVVRVGRSVRESGEGVAALSPELQMMLFIYRMFLMMFLATFASPGFLSRVLVPAYVALVAVLFTYSDLYPQRFLARLMRKREDKLDEDEGVGEGDAPARPSLPK